jgi:Histidine kinase-, DNA gyrase B-, and HSP90-like ATPase
MLDPSSSRSASPFNNLYLYRPALLHLTAGIARFPEASIARVTDGIYRQPASAIRELISNAYDADATRVVIKTDAPRFERITIEGDGNGMSPDVLAYLLYKYWRKTFDSSAARNIAGGAASGGPVPLRSRVQ